ncbi:MAG TPA: glycosyltransferase family 39 protein [Polyangiaceae bacterium]
MWSRARRLIASASGSRWGLLAALVVLVVLRGLFVDRHHEGVGSDGHYTWLYTRSLVFDHDLDFTNDYALCGDPAHKGALRGTSHPDNPFYLGPSVTWAPVLMLVRALAPAAASAPAKIRLACTGPLVVHTYAIGPLLGALTAWLLYRIGRRYAGDGAAALSTALLVLCTPLVQYASICPSYSHTYDAFWAAVAILAAVRAAERPESLLRWGLAGAALGIDLLQRPVSICYGAVPLAFAIATGLRAPRRMPRLVGSLSALGLGVTLFGVVPQLLVYRYLYGTFFAGAPHGRYYMQYAHTHPWLLLFAPHGGLFFTAPVLWLAVPGFVAMLRSRETRVLAGASLLAAAATIWLSSAALDWDASATFGARRLTSLIALLAPPMSMALARIARWLRARPARATTALALATLVPIACTMAGAARAPSLGVDVSHWTQAELYGQGARVAWGAVDHIGDLAVLPAEIVYYLRYGLPMRTFRETTEPVYTRDYRTMAPPQGDIDLRQGHRGSQVTGFESGDDGMKMTGKRATLVFAAEWPFATDVVVETRCPTPTQLRVGRGTATGAVWFGIQTVGPGDSKVEWQVPSGGFDSGIVELVFERSDPTADVLVTSVHIEDKGPYGPPL